MDVSPTQAADALQQDQDLVVGLVLRRLRSEAAEGEAEPGGLEDAGALRDEIRQLLAHLADAVATDRPGLFLDYVRWAKRYAVSHDVPLEILRRRLRVADEEVRATLEGEAAGLAAAPLAEALRSLDDLEVGDAGDGDANPLGDLHRRYVDALLSGDRHGASRLVMDALDGGASVKDLYLHVFQAAQREIGRRWERNEVSVAQEHFCTAATQLIMSRLYDRVFASKRVGRRLVVASVSGDLHELGARMVADFFEMDGWDTLYLGANSPVESVVEALVSSDAHGLALSATLTSHVRATRDVVEAVRAEPEATDKWILVGGYPFTLDGDLWRDIGADAMARDALSAVQEAERLVQARA